MDEGEDILNAIARELVTEKGIRESAVLVWRSFGRHGKAQGHTSAECRTVVRPVGIVLSERRLCSPVTPSHFVSVWPLDKEAPRAGFSPGNSTRGSSQSWSSYLISKSNT